jgi:ABC-type multidrug transport system fused ATPase/permease subunit
MLLLRENDQRNKLAYAFIMAMTILSCISLCLELVGIVILNKLINGAFIEDATLDLFDTSMQINGIIYIAIFIGAIVTFIMWFRRAYFNVHDFAITPPQYTEGWAAGAWFVPILSLFRPSQIMKEIWFETIAYLQNKTPNAPMEPPMGKLNLWWGTWVTGSILANISSRLFAKSEELDEMIIGYYADGIVSILMIISGITLLQIIREYGELEKELQLVGNHTVENSIFYGNNTTETSL